MMPGIHLSPNPTTARLTQRGVKVFSASATNKEVIDFCTSPAAFITYGIVIRDNNLIDGDAFAAISRCWWLKTLDLGGCRNITGRPATERLTEELGVAVNKSRGPCEWAGVASVVDGWWVGWSLVAGSKISIHEAPWGLTHY